MAFSALTTSTEISWCRSQRNRAGILPGPHSRLAVGIKGKFESGLGKCLLNCGHLGLVAGEETVDFLKPANRAGPDPAFLRKPLDRPVQDGSGRPDLDAGHNM